MFLQLLFALLFINSRIQCNRDSVGQTEQLSLKTMTDLKSKHRGGLIEFNTDLLKRFSTMDYPKREFHLFIIFNALDKETQCQVCGPAAEMLKTSMNIFEKKAKKGSLPSFFASIELKKDMEAFQMMGLDHVPVIYHFGPESRAPKTFENNNPNDGGAILRFITGQSGSELNVEAAFKPAKDYSVLATVATIAAVLGALIYVGLLTPEMVFKNFYVWSISIVSFIIVMLSGFMWVRIRNAPYIGSGPEGPTYVMPNPQAQLGIESRIVTGLTAATFLAFLLLTKVTYKFEDNNRRRIAAMVMSVLYMAGHVALMKVFSQKLPGYPITHLF